MAVTKETVYIEADDEITSIIDKVVSAKAIIVAIVLPKRTSAFQSVVNMKLVKKAAEEAKKKIVLISSEPSINTIAGVAGVHIAQSLTSKPVIPKKAGKDMNETTISSKELEAGVAAATQMPETEKQPADDEPIELDNTSSKAEELPAGSLANTTHTKKKKAFKIPDFGSFKLRMALSIAVAVLLITGWVFGFVILPKAKVTINTDTSSSTVTFDFAARVGAETLDIEKAIIPATKVEVVKEDKVTIPTTGQKDIGQKATGSVTFSMKDCSVNEVTIPSGTAISANGLSYITTEDATMQSVKFGNLCRNEDFKQFSTDTVDVVAQQAGANYNKAAGAYTVGVATVTAYGSDMTGGTSQVIQVVSDEDIEKAKAQLKGSATADALTELKKKLENQELQALNETLEETEPVVKSTPAVGVESAELTVTQTVTYRMLGVKTSDISMILDDRIKKSLGDAKDKNVRNNGLGTAAYRLATKTSVDDQTLNLQTIAVIGPSFDENAIASEVAGKKRGDIEKMLEARDGVRSVSVEYSPLWITTTPKSAEKITIIVNELSN